MKCYQLASDQIQKDLGEQELTGKVILENFVNGYFYLYTHLHELPKDALYIIIDKYPETISMYKKLISALNLDRDILYIGGCIHGLSAGGTLCGCQCGVFQLY